MKSNIQDKSLADLVTERLDRAKVLSEFGLDFCCGGGKSLRIACKEKGLDVQRVVEELSNLDVSTKQNSSRDWSQASITELVDNIESVHHSFLWSELARLNSLAGKVTEVHGKNHPELLEARSLFLKMRENLEEHSRKEEQILFPMCRTLDTSSELPSFHCGSINNPLKQMEDEHDTAGNALRKLRELNNSYVPPEDACESYKALLSGLEQLESDLHIHVHKENNVLFPKVREAEKRLSEARKI